jgi:NAD+ kinase
MKTIGITANVKKKRAAEALKVVCNDALACGFDVVVDTASASMIDIDVAASDSIYSGVDAIVALGGDGTMLRTTRELKGAEIPILGINIGNLGFLTSIALQDSASAFKALAEGKFNLNVRALLDCQVARGDEALSSYQALNDVVVTNASPSRVVTLNVAVDADKGTQFVGDGLIVCTPSGSTGHSLSSGGPIVHPGVDGMIMSPICPQTLSSRPMVVPADSVIQIDVMSSTRQVMLTMDGQVSLPLQTGDKIKVGASDKCVKFVQMQDYSYFSVLRRKLHWSLSNSRDADS